MRVPTTKTKLHLICIYHLVICTRSLLDHVRAVIVNCKLSSWTTALWISSDRVMSGLVIPLHITMWISSPTHRPQSSNTHTIRSCMTHDMTDIENISSQEMVQHWKYFNFKINFLRSNGFDVGEMLSVSTLQREAFESLKLSKHLNT